MPLAHKSGRGTGAPKRTAPSPARKVGRRRLRLVLVAVTLASLLLGGRAIYLTVADADGLQALAAEQPTESQNVASGRGRHTHVRRPAARHESGPVSSGRNALPDREP